MKACQQGVWWVQRPGGRSVHVFAELQKDLGGWGEGVEETGTRQVGRGAGFKGSVATWELRFHFRCSWLPLEGPPLQGLQATKGEGTKWGIRGNTETHGKLCTCQERGGSLGSPSLGVRGVCRT